MSLKRKGPGIMPRMDCNAVSVVGCVIVQKGSKNARHKFGMMKRKEVSRLSSRSAEEKTKDVVATEKLARSCPFEV